ncbi:MAG: hypothetical protein QOD06_77 [Candidatus Binatota bacterium]|nr:hypothetical protein [Candidatus Binatota bacterium]
MGQKPFESNRSSPERSAANWYPWLRRGRFRTSVAYLVSLAIHAGIFLLLLATVVLDGGGGPGDSYGGEGKLFSLLSGHGRLDYQTERMEKSDSLHEEIAKAVQQVEPLPEVTNEEVVPEIAEEGVKLAAVAPRINTVPQAASSMRNMAPASTGGGMALGPGVGAGGGLGGGIGRGFGRGFGDFVGLLQKWGFDAVFVIDATNSMEFAISAVRGRIADLVGDIQQLVPNARVGLVVYKDKGEDFVVRKSDLSFRLEKLRAFVSSVETSGGGDYEEGVLDGLRTAVQEITWRQYAHRVIVLVPSSPPRRDEMPEIESLVTGFHSKGGMLHVIDLADLMHVNFEREFEKRMYGKEPEKITALPDFYRDMQTFFTRLAGEGGGQMIALQSKQAITEQLLIAAFGPRWKAEVAKLSK